MKSAVLFLAALFGLAAVVEIRSSRIPPTSVNQSMAPNPSLSKVDDALAYKFERGGSTYLLSWTHVRTYEVFIEKSTNGKWSICYQGTTMGKPHLRQTRESLSLYLVQPHFQIDSPQPKAGHNYYEVVKVSEAGIQESTVHLQTLID